MARSPALSDEALLLKLLGVFREDGFEAATLSKLAAATGLKRASLYHRFPGGKAQMAREALGVNRRWMEHHVIAVLRGLGSPRDRLDAAAAALQRLYGGGKESSLINLFGTPKLDAPELAADVQQLASQLIGAVAAVLQDAGFSGDEARRRALQGVVTVEGALVLSRTFRDTAPFEAALGRWSHDLLEGAPAQYGEPPQPAAATKPEEEVNPVRAAVAAHLRALQNRD